MMAVLAIDPGKKTGGCLLSHGALPIAFAITTPPAWQIFRIVRWAAAQALERGEELELFVEDQHLARGPKVNPASTIDLARRAERWAMTADLLGLRWRREQPSRWHVELASVPAIDDDGRKLTQKQRAAILVQRLYVELPYCRGELGHDLIGPCPTTTLPQDPIEAIVMARFASFNTSRPKRGQAPKKRGRR